MLNSYAGLIIPAIFNAFGIFLLRQFYLSLPRELEEAALIDGAGYWRIYWSIILPLSRPILVGARDPLLPRQLERVPLAADGHQRPGPLGGAGRRSPTSSSQYAASWNYIMAASTIVALPMLILFVIFQRQIMESIKTSGLK